jgi:hypothetical protein
MPQATTATFNKSDVFEPAGRKNLPRFCAPQSVPSNTQTSHGQQSNLGNY